MAHRDVERDPSAPLALRSAIIAPCIPAPLPAALVNRGKRRVLHREVLRPRSFDLTAYFVLMPPSQKSRCPAPSCEATGRYQRGAAAKLIAADVHGEWVDNARRCSFCGCVYSDDSTTKVIRGYLDDYLHGKGWKPNGPPHALPRGGIPIVVNIAKLPSVPRQILKDIPRPPNSASRDD